MKDEDFEHDDEFYENFTGSEEIEKELAERKEASKNSFNISVERSDDNLEDYTKKIDENLQKQNQALIFLEKIKNQLEFLKSESFQALNLKEKKNYFLNTVNDFKVLKKNHFEFLSSYREKQLQDQFRTTSDNIGEMQIIVSTYPTSNPNTFFLNIRDLNESFSSVLEVIERGKKLYLKLNNQIELLLKEFFETFEKAYELTMKSDSEAVEEATYSFCVAKQFNYLNDQKDLFLLNYASATIGLNQKEVDWQIKFKQLVLEMQNFINGEDCLIILKDTFSHYSSVKLLNEKKIDFKTLQILMQEEAF